MVVYAWNEKWFVVLDNSEIELEMFVKIKGCALKRDNCKTCLVFLVLSVIGLPINWIIKVTHEWIIG